MRRNLYLLSYHSCLVAVSFCYHLPSRTAVHSSSTPQKNVQLLYIVRWAGAVWEVFKIDVMIPSLYKRSQQKENRKESPHKFNFLISSLIISIFIVIIIITLWLFFIRGTERKNEMRRKIFNRQHKKIILCRRLIKKWRRRRSAQKRT